MKNSLRKVMSLALTVVMLFSLLLPVTGVMATELPTIELTLVDDNGTALTQLYPSANAHLRISLKNVTTFNTLSCEINLNNMEFTNTVATGFRNVFVSSSNATTLNEFEFNKGGQLNGYNSAISLGCAFTAALDATTKTVTLNGEDVAIVDVPVKVTGEIGKKAEATINVTNDNKLPYIQTGATDDDQQYITGNVEDTAAAINFEMGITEKPYTIASLELVGDPINISKTIEDVDVEALFIGREIKATMTEDRDDDGSNDTRVYKIEGPTTLAVNEYARFDSNDTNSVDANAAAGTTVYVTVNIVDSGVTSDSVKTVEIPVTITASKKTNVMKVNPDAEPISIRYGMTADKVQQLVAACGGLFVAKYEDGTYAPENISITAENVSVNEGYNNVLIGGTQKVTITAPEGWTIEPDGNQAPISVAGTTIKSIKFSSAWESRPQGKEGTGFPTSEFNAANLKIKATLDGDTSEIDSVEFDIRTIDAFPEELEDDTAYIETASYKGDTIGTYNLPVKIAAKKIGGTNNGETYTYTSAIEMEVSAPVASGKLSLDEDAYLRIDYTDNEATAKSNAVAAVEAAKASLFFDVLTNGNLSTDYSIAVITVGSDDAVYKADENKVVVKVTVDGDYKFEDGETTAYVSVNLGEPPAITAAKFVDADDKDITPSIVAAVANDYTTEDNYPTKIDWSDFKVKATYANPNPNDTANPTLTETYAYDKDGGNKSFTVSGWKDFKDGGTVGEQNVTVTITDASKKDGGKALTLTAKITEAEKIGLVRVKDDAKISIKNGKDEEFAKDAILNADNLFEAFYTDNTWKNVELKADSCTISDDLDDYTVAGNYEFSVNLADGNSHYINDVLNNTGILTIKKKSSGGSSAGTVVGGGGVVSGTKKDEPAEDPADEPTTPAEPTDPADPNAPAEPTEPAEPTNPSAPAEEPGAAPDVPKSHWANDIIAGLIERGIISGDSAGNINPDNLISREEAAKIMAMAGGFDMDADLDGITDAASISDWAKAYVAAALKAGAFTGYADGSFGGKDMVTREQFAAIVIRAFGFGEGTGDLTFTDADAIGWSKAFIAKAAELGIVTGYSDGSFRPTATITRAEAFAMVNRALRLKEALDAVVNDEADVADDTADVADDTADVTDEADVADDTADVADEAETADDEADVAEDAADVDDTADVADVADETADEAEEAEDAE